MTLSRAGAAPKLKEQQCFVGSIQKPSTGDFFREKTRRQPAEVGAPRLAPFRLAEERELTANRFLVTFLEIWRIRNRGTVEIEHKQVK